MYGAWQREQKSQREKEVRVTYLLFYAGRSPFKSNVRNVKYLCLFNSSNDAIHGGCHAITRSITY